MSLVANLRTIRAPVMAFLAMGVFWGAWHALIPRVKFDAGASDAALGSALLCVAVGAIPAMMLGGQLVGRLGPWLLPASIALFGIAAMLPTLADDPIELGAALLVVGAASGFMDIMGNVRVSELESREKAGFMHLAHGLFSAAYLFAALSTGLARSIGIGPTAILGAVAAIMLAQAVCAVTRPPSPLRDPEPEVPAGRILSLPVVLFGGIVFAAFLAENGLQSWSALHLERSLAAAPTIDALGPAAIGLASFVGRVGGHFLTARIGEYAIIIASALVATVAVAIFATSSAIMPALAALFVAAAGISIIAPSAIGMAGRAAAPAKRGSAVATVSVMGYTGFFVGPAMLGFVAEHFGITIALGTVALILAAVMPLSLAAKRSAASDRGAGSSCQYDHN
ncbi:MFS transporter [Mesorhizobium sp. WSM2239]|uniref:MFS transporter n=2 Tax=unclassified Mesorhizobium TaxID=325217 RepID=A0AAU8DHJ5_9HYPH